MPCLVMFSSVVLVVYAIMRDTQASMSNDFTVEIISPGISYISSLTSLPITGPAIDMGVEEIQKIYDKHFKVKLTYLSSPSVLNCDDAAAGFDYMVSDYYYRTRVPANLTLFTYPGCYMEAVAVAKLGAGWNQLVLVGSYNENSWRNKVLYPNLIQAGPIMARPLLRAMTGLLRKYNWKTVHTVCDKGGAAGAVAVIGSRAVTAQLQGTPGFVAYLSTVDTTKNETFTAAIKDIKNTARIITFWGHASSLRKFMVLAHQNNMTNGDYAYITLAPFEYPTPLYGNVTWQNNDQWDEIAFAAYRSLFVVTPSPSSEEGRKARESMYPELIRRSKAKYNYTYKPGDVPSPIVMTQYACQHMLGVVINETLTNLNGSVSFVEQSGDLAKLFWNRTIPTPIGPLSFDEVGERRVQQEIQQMNLMTGRFEPVLVQNPVTFELSGLNPLIWFNGDLPRNIPECGFTGQTGPCALAAAGERRTTIAIAAGVIGGVAVFLIITTHLVRKLAAEAQLRSIKFELERPLNFDRNVLDSNTGAAQVKIHEALNKDHPVSITACRIPSQNNQKLAMGLRNREFLRCAKATLDLIHPNIVRFFGIELSEACVLFVHDRGQRGSVKQFLTNPPITIDRDLKSGLAIDLLRAAKAVNTHIPMRFHGLISCSTCVIDSHFSLKITDFGIHSMMKCGFGVDTFTEHSLADQFHIASEIIDTKEFARTTTKSNLYSAGTVILEIITEKILEKHSAVASMADGAPAVAAIKNQDLQKAIWRCMEEDPQNRGTTERLLQLFQAGGSKRTVAEKVIRTLSKYANDLEHAVSLRTQDLLVERQKCDALLQHMLPVTVVEKLRRREPVHPETFDSVTLQFSDIVGFMEFVRDGRPFDVVDFLNKSHGLFDDTISTFSVYKVETISDTYFIASGLPKRIGDKHASEICRVAICLLTAFKEKFRKSSMQLRIGIHSGSCVAAVAGLQRPRYCLFGDTVNTTSRMETYGEGSKVHLSSTTAALLKETCTDLKCIPRGTIRIKGKGLMETFWLTITPDG